MKLPFSPDWQIWPTGTTKVMKKSSKALNHWVLEIAIIMHNTRASSAKSVLFLDLAPAQLKVHSGNTQIQPEDIPMVVT